MTAPALAIDERDLAPGIDYAAIRKQFFFGLSQGLSVERMSFDEFFPKAWPLLDPLNDLLHNWHMDAIAEHLEAVDKGEILRLVINVPPRSLKSALLNAWAAWTWTIRPWQKFMFVSYSRELAVRHSLDRRRVMESPWYQEKWGAIVQMQSDQDKKNHFENTARGEMMATSVKGGATGMGADVIVFDDLINPKEAESKVERERSIVAFDATFSSRLNDKKLGKMIIVEQRLHKNDLTAHVLKRGDWTHLNLPAEADKRTVITFPISKRVVVREVGDILHPEREGRPELDQAKRALGSRGYAAQYIQNPSSEDGSMVKRRWWKFYHDEPTIMVRHMQVVAQSWDFAFKELNTSSYVVGLVGGRRGADKYIFDEFRDHMDFSGACRAVEAATSKWPMATHKFYEDAANGPAVKSALTRRVSGLIAVPPIGSKVARMAAAAPDIEAGNVLLPYPYDDAGAVLPGRQWVLDFIEELANFPDEPNDRGDALSQFVTMINAVNLDQEQEGPSGNFLDDMDMTDDFGGFINV
jgi:predicted phage terminase large subunit-like protein